MGISLTLYTNPFFINLRGKPVIPNEVRKLSSIPAARVLH